MTVATYCDKCTKFDECFPGYRSRGNSTLHVGDCPNYEPTAQEDDAPDYQFYLFVFQNGDIYEMTCGVSLKDAIWEMAKYRNISSEHMRKSLEVFDDKDDIIKQVNFYISDNPIEHIYIVKERIL